jgi:hypothetical protein
VKREAEQAADSREYDEINRKVTIGNHTTNFRTFVKEEGRRNWQFDRILPLA